MDYSDLPSEDTWVGYLRTRLPYSFSEIHEQKPQYILSEPLLSIHLAEHHNFWKRGYVYYAVGKLIDIYGLSVYWREYRILHTDKLRNEHSGMVDHLSKQPRDVFNALQLEKLWAVVTGVGAQPFGCDEAAVGSLATVTAAGARSRHEIKGPSEVQDEVSRGKWSAYEQALVQRGDVTLWLSADATDAWRPAPSGRPGAPKTFSDCAIETALTLRLVFRLPLRQAEGFLRSVLSLLGVDLAAPDHTTLSRRSQSLAVEFRRIPSRGPLHLIVDSTGRSIVGEGEWGRWCTTLRLRRGSCRLSGHGDHCGCTIST